MSETLNNCCIIDAMCGMGTSSPTISRFTDNFDSIKFLMGKNFDEYTMIIVTDIDGHVEIVNTDGETLIKETNANTGETSLTWKIGRNITAESGVIIYQIAGFKSDDDTVESVWYSKEGRLLVTESIDTTSYSATVIGAYPNLLTRLLTQTDQIKTLTETLRSSKVDIVEGMGLSEKSYSGDEKEKLASIEAGAQVNVQSDWNESNENADSFIKNKPNLKKVATSGSYNDLSDTPEIPSIDGLATEAYVDGELSDVNSKINILSDESVKNTTAISKLSEDLTTTVQSELADVRDEIDTIKDDLRLHQNTLDELESKVEDNRIEIMQNGVVLSQHDMEFESLKEQLGDINSALEHIIALDNELLGVSE